MMDRNSVKYLKSGSSLILDEMCDAKAIGASITLRALYILHEYNIYIYSHSFDGSFPQIKGGNYLPVYPHLC